MTRILTSLLSASIFALASCAAAPVAEAETPAAKSSTKAMTQQQRFDQWKKVFITEAVGKGYDLALLNQVIAPAQINPKAIERNDNQPEFSKPVWSYVDGVASNARVQGGRNKMTETDAVFDAVEARYRVPREILTAIWGLETSYGKIMGNHDIVDSLATFAFEGRRQKFGTQQLYAVLDLLKAGDIRQDQLTGAWAGAMGMTQFIPTTFRDYAVDFDGDGYKDLWNNPADALGSAAHYLSRFGWREGEPIMTEVRLPTGFDYSVTDGSKRTVNQWTAMGIEPVSGQRWSAGAGFLEAKLISPGGSRGPKFLTFKNFDVLKRYNNSTSYVMGLSVLSDTFEGKPGIVQDWPRGDKPLSFEDKKALQQRLTDLGYTTGGVDGMIGPNSRRAIRAWQAANGLPADGYIEQRLFRKLMGS